MAEKVMVAMSGGVDSSVAAAILKDKGYEITGATLKLFDNEEIGICEKQKTCCAVKDIEDARNVALTLGFPFYVFNFKDRFIEQVIERFVRGYINGETPNPCIDCNRYIKFSELLTRASLLENDFIATGHYAKIEYDNASKRYLLKKPVDLTKDQTYVLYALTQEQLSKTKFVLGDYKKSEVREIAEKIGLYNAKKPDSQDICFVKDGKYGDFIESYTGIKFEKGNFVDKSGKIYGQHKGIINYTIGQRKGLGIAHSEPLFVLNKDIENNTVIVGTEKEQYSKTLIASDINLIVNDKLQGQLKVYAKTRYRQKEQKATIQLIDNDKILVEFDQPQRAITKGQAVVFYDGDIVVGGGTIQ